MDTPRRYRAFGGVLEVPFDLPALRVAPPGATSDWIVRAAPQGARPPAAGDPLGRAHVEDGVEVVLARAAGDWLLQFTDTGSYLVRHDGAEITWFPGPRPEPANVRNDVVGRVMATALHAAGRPSLHGSAVVLGAHAIALLAPKHHGKSTLALALAERGAQVLSDDVVPLTPGAAPLAWPGVPAIRLLDGSLGVARAAAVARATDAFDKHLAHLEDARIAERPAPLAACYLVQPVPPGPGVPPVQRVPLTALEATLALVGQWKIGALLGGVAAPGMLETAAALARAVPVHRLEVARDLTQLDAACATMEAWHAGSPA